MKKYADGEVLYGSDLNASLNKTMKLQGENIVRQLIDRAVDFSADGESTGEAYVDSNGRLNTVDTGSTTAFYDSDDEIYYNGLADDSTPADTTYDPDSITNAANFFDGNDATYARFSGLETSSPYEITKTLGKTFTEKYVGALKIKVAVDGNDTYLMRKRIILKTYDGSTWTTEKTLLDVTDYTALKSYDDTVYLGKTVQGVAIELFINDSASAPNRELTFYTLAYGSDETSEIVHNLPSGLKIPSSSFLNVLFFSFEDGYSVQYKIANDTEDSGWLDYNEVSEFTALTSEPTTLTIKLNVSSTISAAIKGYSLVLD